MEPTGQNLIPVRKTLVSDRSYKQQRRNGSLTALTTKFVSLLEEAEGGVLDISYAVKVLDVERKRRIYDITNVLEGVGLIVKMSKCLVKWKGTMPGRSTLEVTKRLAELQSEQEDLEQKERMLDLNKFMIEQSLKNTMEDCSDLTYVNHEDICDCFRGHTLLAVRAPSGTQLDVPIPKAVQDCPAKYQIYLKSVNGPIDVTLLNKGSDSSAPVILPVPLPEDILRKAKSNFFSPEEKEGSISPPGQAAAATHRSRQTTMECMRHLQSSSEPSRTNKSELRDLSKELEQLLQPTKEILSAKIIKELLGSEVFSPHLRLPPSQSENDYVCNMNESEGRCELFDVPVFNV